MHLPVTTTVLFFFDVSVFSLLCSSMLVWSEFIRERTWSLLAVSQLAGWLKCLLSFPFLLLLLLVHLFVVRAIFIMTGRTLRGSLSAAAAASHFSRSE